MVQSPLNFLFYWSQLRTRVPGFYLDFSMYGVGGGGGGGMGKLFSEWPAARIEATKFLHVINPMWVSRYFVSIGQFHILRTSLGFRLTRCERSHCN